MNHLRFTKDKVQFDIDVQHAKNDLNWSIVLALFVISYVVYASGSFVVWQHKYELRLQANKHQATSMKYDWETFCQDGVTAQQNAFVVDCRLAQEWRLMNIVELSQREANTPWLLDSSPGVDYSMAIYTFVVAVYICLHYVFLMWRRVRVSMRARDMKMVVGITNYKASLREQTAVTSILKKDKARLLREEDKLKSEFETNMKAITDDRTELESFLLS